MMKMARVIIVLFILVVTLSAQQAKKPAAAPVAANATVPAVNVKPALTMEQLQARLNDLQQARDQAVANLNVLIGRINECQDMIQTLTPSSKKADNKPPAAKP